MSKRSKMNLINDSRFEDRGCEDYEYFPPSELYSYKLGMLLMFIFLAWIIVSVWINLASYKVEAQKTKMDCLNWVE